MQSMQTHFDIYIYIYSDRGSTEFQKQKGSYDMCMHRWMIMEEGTISCFGGSPPPPPRTSKVDRTHATEIERMIARRSPSDRACGDANFRMRSPFRRSRQPNRPLELRRSVRACLKGTHPSCHDRFLPSMRLVPVQLQAQAVEIETPG
jgi:hypothetical protein